MHQNAAVSRGWFWRNEAVLFRRSWRVRELAELPPPDQAAVVRAVERGKAVSDPRLAPCVLTCADAVIASKQRRRVGVSGWVLLAFAAVGLVFSVLETITGPAGDAVTSWLSTVGFLGLASILWVPELQRARAQAAADLAADQIARSSGDYPPSTMPS
jgi:hypothetical protein